MWQMRYCSWKRFWMHKKSRDKKSIDVINKIDKESGAVQKKFRLPRLHPILRLLLYIVMVLCFTWTMIVIRDPAENSAVNYAAYFAGSVTLVLGMIYLVRDLKSVWKYTAAVLRKNAWIESLMEDMEKRTVFFTFSGSVFNAVYAALNISTAVRTSSQWFLSFGVYYGILCGVRLAVMYSWRKARRLPEAEERAGLEQNIHYRVSQILLLLGLVIGGMTVLLMFSKESYKDYQYNLIYLVALYTFIRIILAVRNLIVSSSLKSPLMMCLRKVGYVDACVAMLVLQLSMIAAFGEVRGNFADLANLMTGGIVSLMTLMIGLQGIYAERKNRKRKHQVHS